MPKARGEYDEFLAFEQGCNINISTLSRVEKDANSRRLWENITWGASNVLLGVHVMFWGTIKDDVWPRTRANLPLRWCLGFVSRRGQFAVMAGRNQSTTSGYCSSICVLLNRFGKGKAGTVPSDADEDDLI